MNKKSNSIYSLFWFVFLLIAFGAYFPGLQGGFLFDDFINLRTLGELGGVRDWNTFQAYLESGFSGPTGRPFSLLSFLMDARTWPADPYAFKLTNVLLHLLAGTLLWRLTRELVAQLKPQADPAWVEQVSLLSAGIWLLHPFMLSTTLYVVQRMAQLSAIFAFAAIWGYLLGREKLLENPNKAYLCMTSAVVLGTLFATISKENGVLVPFLILIIEYFICIKNREYKSNKFFNLWKNLLLVLPSFLVIFYLLSHIEFSERTWLMRPFNQAERLMTESRILFDYIFQILIPRIESNGLIQDDYTISKSIWNPISTIFSLIGISFCLVFAFFCKNKLYFLSFAILFFFAGHLLESSTLGLELYFEHRNYLPAAFIFLPISVFFFSKHKLITSKIRITLVFFIISTLAILLHQRANLWSDVENLEAYWSMQRPKSVRAHNNIVKNMLKEGRIHDAKTHLEEAVINVPDSAVLRLLLLLCQMGEGNAEAADFQKVADFMRNARFDVQVFAGLQALSDQVRNEPVYQPYVSGMLEIMHAVEGNPDTQRLPKLIRLTQYSELQLLLARQDWSAAEYHVKQLMYKATHIDEAMALIMELARYQRYQTALDIWPMVEHIYSEQIKKEINDKNRNYDKEMQDVFHQLKLDALK